MEKNIVSVYIVSNQKLRGEIIRDLLLSVSDASYNVMLIGSDQLDITALFGAKPLFIIDFITLNAAPGFIVKSLKESFQDVKIIGMHLYRSPSLIEPLFNMGIDGYLYCEPSRNELIAATQAVLADKSYRAHIS